MPTAGREKKYKRILLKLSGEELMGEEGFGIDPKVLDRMALEIGQLGPPQNPLKNRLQDDPQASQMTAKITPKYIPDPFCTHLVPSLVKP